MVQSLTQGLMVAAVEWYNCGVNAIHLRPAKKSAAESES
jgi:hypothetical protein